MRPARASCRLHGSFVLEAVGLMDGRPATSNGRSRTLPQGTRGALDPDVLLSRRGSADSDGAASGLDSGRTSPHGHGSEVANKGARLWSFSMARRRQASTSSTQCPRHGRGTATARPWALETSTSRALADLAGPPHEPRHFAPASPRGGHQPGTWLSNSASRGQISWRPPDLPVEDIDGQVGSPAAVSARNRHAASSSPALYRALS